MSDPERDLEELGRAIAAVQDERIAPHPLPALTRPPRRRVARWVLVAAGFVAGVAVTLGAMALRDPSALRRLVPAERGTIVVTVLSATGGGNVRVDGRPALRAEPSVAIDHLRAGAHSIVVDEPGFVSYSSRVFLTEEAPLLAVDASLRPDRSIGRVDDGGRREHRGDDVPGDAPASPCQLDAPVADNAKVFAAGAYHGRAIDFPIDDSGHAAGQFDVVVNDTKEPVVLLLGAYDPSIWNVSWTRGTTIAGVVVSGYHRQVVAGLPDDVSLLVTTYDNRAGCGSFYVTSEQRAEVSAAAKRILGRPVDRVFLPDDRGHIVVGDRVAVDAPLESDPAHTPASYRAKDAPRTGDAGLDDAVAAGMLRAATDADAQRWARLSLPNGGRDVPPVSGHGQPRLAAPRVRGERAFVVLKPFAFPPGLYGADAATFFVEKGVPRPTGKPGHSTVYDFNTMTCVGATCSTSDAED